MKWAVKRMIIFFMACALNEEKAGFRAVLQQRGDYVAAVLYVIRAKRLRYLTGSCMLLVV
jgi:hypothetical protein